MSENPNTPEAQAAIQAAVAAFQSGDLATAILLGQRAAKDHPKHPIAHNVTGVFLLQNGQVEEALEAFLIATKLRPDYPEAQNNCGIALSSLLRDDLAIEHYRRAIALKDDYAEAHGNLGTSLEATGAWKPALERFRKAIALDPDYTVGRLNLAGLLRDLGKRDEAAAVYRDLLEAEPNHVEALTGLTMIHRFSDADDPVLTKIDQLRNAGDRTPEERARLTYAAAAARHGLGAHEAAFNLWLQGAEARKAQLAYDPTQVAQEFQQIQAAFPKAPDPIAAPERAVSPLFILGMPRSGPTLVEQMLANHPDVSAAGELDFLETLIRKSGSDKRPPTPSEVAAIRDNFLDRLPQFARGASIVTDKTPANYLWIGHILAAMPEARILHISRDARAVCWSIFRNDFGQMGRGYPTTLRDLAAYWNHYDALMSHWDRIAPGRIITLEYGALVENPEIQMRKLLEQLGLAWRPEVLEFEATERAVKTLSSQQVRRGIYTGSTEAWRLYENQIGSAFDALP